LRNYWRKTDSSTAGLRAEVKINLNPADNSSTTEVTEFHKVPQRAAD
jgi:hypothetical protein